MFLGETPSALSSILQILRMASALHSRRDVVEAEWLSTCAGRADQRH
jgi:hypothetical protein